MARVPDTQHTQSGATVAGSHPSNEDPRPTIHRYLSEIAAAAKELSDYSADPNFEPEMILTLMERLEAVQRRYQHSLMYLLLDLFPPGPLPWERKAQPENVESTRPESAQ